VEMDDSRIIAVCVRCDGELRLLKMSPHKAKHNIFLRRVMGGEIVFSLLGFSTLLEPPVASKYDPSRAIEYRSSTKLW